MTEPLNVTGWLDMGQGLYRKAHYYVDGVAICDKRRTLGMNRSSAAVASSADAFPAPNSCQTCLVKWAETI